MDLTKKEDEIPFERIEREFFNAYDMMAQRDRFMGKRSELKGGNELKWKLKYNGIILIGFCLIVFLICVLITIFNFNYISLIYSIVCGFAGIYLLFGAMFNYYKNKRNSRTGRCHSCGKETGMYMISQWFFGLIKRVHCMECVNKKLRRK